MQRLMWVLLKKSWASQMLHSDPNSLPPLQSLCK